MLNSKFGVSLSNQLEGSLSVQSGFWSDKHARYTYSETLVEISKLFDKGLVPSIGKKDWSAEQFLEWYVKMYDGKHTPLYFYDTSVAGVVAIYEVFTFDGKFSAELKVVNASQFEHSIKGLERTLLNNPEVILPEDVTLEDVAWVLEGTLVKATKHLNIGFGSHEAEVDSQNGVKCLYFSLSFSKTLVAVLVNSQLQWHYYSPMLFA